MIKNDKKEFLLLLLLIFLTAAVSILVGCSNDNTDTEPTKCEIVSANGFEFDNSQDEIILRKTVSNDTKTISLANDVVVSKGATWNLYKDYIGEEEYVLKAMTLNIGNNVAYLVVKDSLNNIKRYEVHVYRLNMCSYSFKCNNEIIFSNSLEENSIIQTPVEDPKKTGYIFCGWKCNNEITSFPYTLTHSTIFVADFLPIEYKITFDSNGGTSITNELSYTIDTELSLPVPSRDFYNFIGWKIDEKVVYRFEKNNYGNKLAVAQWTPQIFNITYNNTQGANVSNCPVQFTVESEPIVLQPLERLGYIFKGWYKDSLYTQALTEIKSGSHDDIDLFAKWSIINYDITYHMNGGNNASLNPDKYTIENAIAFEKPTRKDYTFEGWFVDESMQHNIFEIPVGSTGAIELYAKWQYGTEGLVYTLQNSNAYSVTAYSGTIDTIIIPSTWNNLPITTISPSAFYNCNVLKQITFEENSQLKAIGYNAFKNCNNLQEVLIPSSVTSVGSNLFENCTNLTRLAVPFIGGISATYFGYIFGASSYTENSTYVPTSLKEVIVTGGSTVSTNAFYGCQNIKSINLPASVSNIGYSAFENCTSLQYITFENDSKLSSIASRAFAACSNLINIVIPERVTSIGDAAFLGCMKLQSIVLSKSLNSISQGCFEYCYNLQTVVFENDSNLETIGSLAFYACTKLESIVIPLSTTIIDKAAFDSCSNLHTVYYCGTLEQWKFDDKFASADISIYFYSSDNPFTNGTTEGNYWHYNNGIPMAW